MRFRVSKEVFDLLLMLPCATAGETAQIRADLSLTLGHAVSIECDLSLVEDQWEEVDRDGAIVRRGQGIIRAQ